MNRKIITIFIGIILIAITAIGYRNYKTPIIKKEKSDISLRLAGETADVLRTPGKIEQLKIKRVLESKPDISAIIIINSKGLTERIGKSAGFNETVTAIDRIIEKIKKNTSSGIKTTSPILINGRYTGESYYLLSFPHKDGTASLLVKPSLKSKFMLRMTLEIILLLSLVLICTSIIYMIIRQKNDEKLIEESNVIVIDLTGGKNEEKASVTAEAKNDEEETESPESDEGFSIDETELQFVRDSQSNIVKTDLAAKNIDRTNESVKSLNNSVLNLFKEVKEELPVESIILYIKKMDDRLNKSYELKGKTFLKVDSAILDSIKISDIKHISQSGAIISGDGQNIKIPVLNDNSILGLLELKLSSNVSSLNLESVKEKLKNFSGKVRDYLSINNVIFNRETGLYSETYYNMKLDEMNYKKEKENTGYSTISIDIFPTENISEKQKNMILKIIHSETISTNSIDSLYHNGRYVSAILDTTERDVLEKKKHELAKAVGKFRIKAADTVISLRPRIEYSVKE